MPVLENAKHEKMVQLKVKGYSQRQAYKEVYDNNMTDEQIDIEASKIFNSPKVSLRYQELINELKEDAIMSAKERMIWLTNVINGTEKEANDRIADLNTKIKALDTLNKMDNTYQQNIKVSGNINNPLVGLTKEELDKIINDTK